MGTECHKQSTADPRAFSKWIGGEFVVMCIHVDDFYVIASRTSLIDQLYGQLCDEYGQVAVKDDNLLAYLGMHIHNDTVNHTVTITQPGYIRRIVEEYMDPTLVGKSTPRTPMSVIVTPRNGDDKPIDQTLYLPVQPS